MSTIVFRWTWSRIDERRDGIIPECSIGPRSSRSTDQAPCRAARWSSGADGGEARIVREAGCGEVAEPCPRRAIPGQLRESPEERELVRCRAPPAAVQIELGKQQVDVGIRRKDRERLVTGVHRRVEL